MDAIAEQEQIIETAQASMTEIEEEQSGEDGVFDGMDKINQTEVKKLLKELDEEEEIAIVKEYLAESENIRKARAEIKKLEADLEKQVIEKYPTLDLDEIKKVLIHDKWTVFLKDALKQEQDKISQNLTQNIQDLAERYESTLPKLEAELVEVTAKVKLHLEKMGWSW